MGVYYVTHPNISLSAKVTAPSTDKARTTFLDWLERQGSVYRSDRQHWRKNMIAEKLTDPEDVWADTELSYGYEDVGRQVPEDLPPYGSERMDYEPPEEPYHEDIGMPEFEEDRYLQGRADELPPPPPRKLSPIQRRALRGY